MLITEHVPTFIIVVIIIIIIILIFRFQVMQTKIDSGIKLYKHLLRLVQKLPEASQREYYKNYVRNQYRSHSDETDKERVNFIIERSLEHSQWIMNKYLKK